jgi:hypothetical protein
MVLELEGVFLYVVGLLVYCLWFFGGVLTCLPNTYSRVIVST